MHRAILYFFCCLVALLLLAVDTHAASFVAQVKGSGCGCGNKKGGAKGNTNGDADGKACPINPATAEPGKAAPPAEKKPSKCPISTYCTLYNFLLAAAVVTGIAFVVIFAKYCLPTTGKQ